MIIAGLQKNSLVDYRGKVAAVVFTPFCNFNCYYCHNRILLETDASKTRYKTIDEDEFFAFLDKRVGLIQGVVVTGGEPTLQKDLPEFIRRIREKGFPVKLDTNGGRPEVVSALLEEGLLDSIAMDIKAPFERYDEICGVEVNHENIKRSMQLIMNSGLDYELRTTVTPEFTLDDIRGIAKMIDGCALYVLQQFRKPENHGEFADIRNAKKPHHRAFFDQAVEICTPHATRVITRGVNL
ncbi:MAG: anaerobic ribonucleoside-triphosphate reductase activating protein [Clostridiales bacterium]|nr:anaerobic ribonucleoside-triphosphate reductase activating protein [Clostridiales bacterium]